VIAALKGVSEKEVCEAAWRNTLSMLKIDI
jgi:hypothetical protein